MPPALFPWLIYPIGEGVFRILGTEARGPGPAEEVPAREEPATATLQQATAGVLCFNTPAYNIVVVTFALEFIFTAKLCGWPCQADTATTALCASRRQQLNSRRLKPFFSFF